MEPIINITRLKKSFDSIIVVNGISFSIDKGEMFGLVGPDGAGKTTTIKILSGLLDFNEGIVELLNKNIKNEKKKIQRSIGYLSQKFSLYRDLTIDENIEFFAEIHNVKDFHGIRNELLEFTRLKNFRNRLADKLSGGMKQKLALACSLIHKPKILLLDEADASLDKKTAKNVLKTLTEFIKTNKSSIIRVQHHDWDNEATKKIEI